MSPDRSIKTSQSAHLRVTGSGKKTFVSISLSITMRYVTSWWLCTLYCIEVLSKKVKILVPRVKRPGKAVPLLNSGSRCQVSGIISLSYKCSKKTIFLSAKIPITFEVKTIWILAVLHTPLFPSFHPLY